MSLLFKLYYWKRVNHANILSHSRCSKIFAECVIILKDGTWWHAGITLDASYERRDSDLDAYRWRNRKGDKETVSTRLTYLITTDPVSWHRVDTLASSHARCLLTAIAPEWSRTGIARIAREKISAMPRLLPSFWWEAKWTRWEDSFRE